MYDHAYDESFMPPYIGMPIEAIWEAVAQYPKRFVAGYAPDPKRPHAIERLKGRLMEYLRSLDLPAEVVEALLSGNALRLVPLS